MNKEFVKLSGDGLHDDTAAIQHLLDIGGEVNIPDGCYLITQPLIIHSNTHLKLSRNAYMRLADHANCSLLDNDGLYTGNKNSNIIIEGGIWDGNNSAQERVLIDNENLPCNFDTYVSNKLAVLLMRMVHTEKLIIRNLIYKDPTSFAVQIADVKYFTVENITLDYNLTKLNMDGIHIQGPAKFGKIHNIMGDANDDHVALCANGTTRSEITRGIIENIDISGIYCENGYTGVRLLSCGDAVRNIHVHDIHGKFRFYAVSFTHHYPISDDRPIMLENIHLSDIHVSKSDYDFPEQKNPTGALIWFESGITCKNIAIDNVFRNETTDTTAPTIRISGDTNINGLKVNNIYESSVKERHFETIENESNITDFTFIP